MAVVGGVERRAGAAGRRFEAPGLRDQVVGEYPAVRVAADAQTGMATASIRKFIFIEVTS